MDEQRTNDGNRSIDEVRKKSLIQQQRYPLKRHEKLSSRKLRLLIR